MEEYGVDPKIVNWLGDLLNGGSELPDVIQSFSSIIHPSISEIFYQVNQVLNLPIFMASDEKVAFIFSKFEFLFASFFGKILDKTLLTQPLDPGIASLV